MSEATNQENPTVDEKTLLKQQCKVMGIPVQGNPSVDTLKALIEDFKKDQAGTNEAPDVIKGESKQARHKRIREHATKLIRCRITNMNPNKSAMQGEIFSVGNRVIGTHKKFIPYNPSTHEDGYHIPNALYEALKTRKYQFFKPVKHPNGETTQESVLVNEFAIEVLPPLTPEELTALSVAQKAKGGISD